jgi:hypothetical protein
MEFKIRPPKPQRIGAAPAGRGSKPRPDVAVTAEYVRSLLVEQRITERDEALLRYLDEVAVLSSRQIQRLLWPGSSQANMRRRLRQLYDYHVLDRVRMVSKAEGITYALGKAGWMWLHEGDRVARNPVRVNAQTVAHDLMVSEVLVLLAEALRHIDDVSGKQYQMRWYGEEDCRVVEEKQGKSVISLEPDSFFAVLTEGTPVAAGYVEADQGSERGEAIQRKLHRYYAAAGKDRLRYLGGRHPLVMMVTKSGARAGSLADQVARFQRETQTAARIDWVVTPLSALTPATFLTGAPWYVVEKGAVAEREVDFLDGQNGQQAG